MAMATLGAQGVNAADQLLQVLVDLSFARTMDELAAVARAGARRLTRADGVTFVIKDGEYCHYADEDAIEPLWKGRRFPIRECISGWVMTNRQSAVVPDISADARIPHEVYRPTFVRSLAIVPVRTDDPVGAIGAYWAAVHEATPAELDLLQAIANGAALAMANVRLYQDLEEAADRERKARLAAEDANRLKDRLLATVSHELRTPLGVIQGWLWQVRLPGTSPDTLDRALSVIDRNIAIQVRLVEDLLDASHAVAGALRLRWSDVDLHSVCRRVLDMGRAAAAAKGVRLALEADAGPLPVHGDADRLQQALWHLVDNAIKFTGAGGSVTVVSSRVGDRAQLTVRDTGIGIAPSFLPQAFDPFRQGDSSMTREYGGLGLGLTIVQEVVARHEGRIHAERPRSGPGTTMTIDLPLAAAPEPSLQEARSRPTTGPDGFHGERTGAGTGSPAADARGR
jgi:two-component system CheB/CheR fusion protein